MRRSAPLARNSQMPWQEFRTASDGSGGTTVLATQEDDFSASTDGVTIEYSSDLKLRVREGGIGGEHLDPTDADDGEAYVYDEATETFTLQAVPRLDGLTAGRIPYAYSASILRNSPFRTDGTTVGLNTAETAGIALLATQQTSTGTILKLDHTGTGGNGLHINTTDAARGVLVETQASSSGVAVQIENAGSSTALYVRTTTGGAGAIFQSTDNTNDSILVDLDHAGENQALRVVRSSATATTNPAVEIRDNVDNDSTALSVESAGTNARAASFESISTNVDAVTITQTGGSGGHALHVVAAGATGLRVEVSGGSRGAHFSIDNDASSAAVVYATGNGAGATIDAVATGEGNAIHADIANLDSTSSLIRGTHSGNGILLDLYRNVSTATAAMAYLHADASGDAGHVLRLRHDGSGSLLRGEVNGNGHGVSIEVQGSGRGVDVNHLGTGTGIYVTANGATANAIFASAAGSAAAIWAIAGTGDAIEATGRIKTTNFRMTATSPDVDKVLHSTDTDGNAEWKYLEDITCLTSIITGSNALGNIALLPLDALVAIPRDTANPVVCNGQWDDTSNLGVFTPTKNLDRSGTTTDGVTLIIAHFRAQWPAGATASDLTLTVTKNGVPLREDSDYFNVSGRKVRLTVVVMDRFTGTDDYDFYLSQNVAGAAVTFTSWSFRVETAYQHTDECPDCLG